MLIALRGVAHHSPMRRRGWLLVLCGFVGRVVADLAVSIEQQRSSSGHGTAYDDHPVRARASDDRRKRIHYATTATATPCRRRAP
jgi:hypothetical protein